MAAIKKLPFLTGNGNNIYKNKKTGAIFANVIKNGKKVKVHNPVAMKRAGGGKIRSNKGVPRKIAPSKMTMKNMY